MGKKAGRQARHGLARAAKPRRLPRTMDRGFARLVVAAVFASLIGCGARTDPFDDPGSSGAGASAGRGQGGASAGTGGAHRAGAPGAGAPQGGAPQAGAAPVAGAPQGGAPQGGAPQGGAAPVAGAGGFGAISGAAGGGPIVDACVALAPSACGKCLCQSCSSEVVACFSDLGCALIFACVEQTGCQGLACYSAGTCRTVIDNAGGLTGRSVNNVFSILSCAVTSQSACLCN